MTADRSGEIIEIIERESRAFETADAELMLTIYHPDMVWAWPPHAKAHDPMEWIMRVGRFDYEMARNDQTFYGHSQANP